jgi:gliding motility-associated-like protein
VRPAAVTVEAAGLIKFPNAFKPYMHGGNGGYYSLENDEQNLIFHPYWEGVDHYHLEIYNRWGERLFTSEEVNIGWDGYFNEELCDQGVYFFKCTGTFINGVPFRVVGDVTLIHHDKGVEYPPR